MVDRLVPVPAADDPTLAEIAVLARASRDLSAAGPAGYLYPSPLIPLDTAIRDYCLPDLDPARGALDAGIALARRIQHDFAFDADATIVTTAPAEAFAQRRGVCQDFAQIMIAGLRAAGLPAAYASGYIRTIPPPGQPRLVGADATHAWVLMWCGPVRGWVGLRSYQRHLDGGGPYRDGGRSRLCGDRADRRRRAGGQRAGHGRQRRCRAGGRIRRLIAYRAPLPHIGE